MSLLWCTATFAQVVLDHAEEFLKEMNSKVIANKLKAVKLISETVENGILQSEDEEEANAHLLQHLKQDADEETVKEIFRIASETTGNGKMSTFATGVLRKLQRGLYGVCTFSFCCCVVQMDSPDE